MKYRKLTPGEQVQHAVKFPGQKYKYICLERNALYIKRYGKWIVCEDGMLSDGATGAMDIDSDAWWFHDKLCSTGKWEDGTKCTNWQASFVVSWILFKEWKRQPFKKPFRGLRAILWRPATFLFGGGEARKNGMFRIS